MTDDIIAALLERSGTTFAEQAGIALADKPAPLYRLLVLTTLMSARVRADMAVAAARELPGTPHAMRESSWQERVDALDRARYTRYDDSTATALGEGAQLLHDEYRDDLRRLRAAAGDDPARTRELLMTFPRIGPVGADIFCREAQDVWPSLRPAFDGKALDGADRLGLPRDPAELGRLAPPDGHARLAAALVRVALDGRAAADVAAAAAP